MANELKCEELENEKTRIVEILCDPKRYHALGVDHFVTQGMERSTVIAALSCLTNEGIIYEKVEDVFSAVEQYDLCDKEKDCEGISSSSTV